MHGFGDGAAGWPLALAAVPQGRHGLGQGRTYASPPQPALIPLSLTVRLRRSVPVPASLRSSWPRVIGTEGLDAVLLRAVIKALVGCDPRVSRLARLASPIFSHAGMSVG